MVSAYFLNIKEHADDGERDLYVMDLVIAHRRQWGWRFVDTFCWRKTDNGVPGGWGNRFKNAWEPVFHFCRQQQIKFRPQAVSHESEDCFDYSPNNPKSNSGSGLLGTGTRGAAADGGKNQSAWQRSRNSLSDDSDEFELAEILESRLHLLPQLLARFLTRLRFIGGEKRRKYGIACHPQQRDRSSATVEVSVAVSHTGTSSRAAMMRLAGLAHTVDSLADLRSRKDCCPVGSQWKAAI